MTSRDPILREVRVFISSTFRDLEEVRHKLTIDAFPKLRRHSADLGVAFTEIDLRWGITDDDSKSAQVLKICLEEVQHCAKYPPFFVGILGERYGWIPDDTDWANAHAITEGLPGFVERHRGKSITELEIQFGVLERLNMISSAFFYFIGNENNEEEPQKELKQKIRNIGASYRDGIKSPEELSNLLFNDLANSIESLYPRNTVPDRFEQMLAMQTIYSSRLAEHHIASENSFNHLATQISSTRLCCLTGISGSGKSSFLSAYVQNLLSLKPSSHVFLHHIGVAESKTRFDWMAALYVWARSLGLSELVIPETTVEIQANLPSLLASLEMRGDVTIILDAIEQLDEKVLPEEWLPFDNGNEIRWVVSTTCLDQVTYFKKNGWLTTSVSPLDQILAEEIMSVGLAKYRKQLPKELLLQVIQHPKATHPLFLKVLCDELRIHGKHETLRDLVNKLLSSDSIEVLFKQFIQRVTESAGNHVHDLLTLLCIARHGASEPELRSVLDIRQWDIQQTLLLTEQYLIKHRGLFSPFHEALRRSLLVDQEPLCLIQRWCHYWRFATDPHRRFVEYPHALLILSDWKSLASWVYEPNTLAYAGENNLVETLASWHALITKKIESAIIPEIGDLTAWSLDSLRGLRELSYQIGNWSLESEALNAQRGRSGLHEYQWLIENSLLYYRRGNQQEAQSYAQYAVEQAVDRRAILEARMNLIQMLAFGNSPQEAYSLANLIAKDASTILETDKVAEAYLCQYTSIACHFLDLNKQSYRLSIRAAEIYGALGRKYDQGISLINAGDGAWGSGDFKEANRCLKLGLEMANQYLLPHLEDIAKICLANLRMSEGKVGEAVKLYAEGIKIAEAIGQDWDSLYGRIYQALALARQKKSGFDLRSMMNEAKTSGYLYLEDLARAHMIVLGIANRSDVKKLRISPFPGVRAYALAHETLRNGKYKKSLIELVKHTEGIKGPIKYIRKAQWN